jgi:hypothetical protein
MLSCRVWVLCYTLATDALCGFANFASTANQTGGIGSIVRAVEMIWPDWGGGRWPVDHWQVI